MDDAKEYHETRKAMDVVGINSEEQVIIFWVIPLVNIMVSTYECFFI